MGSEHSREEIRAVLKASETIVVATHGGGGEIRTRQMHFVVDQDFNVYLASMKADPKTVQITHHPTVSLFCYAPEVNLADSNEIEMTGTAVKVKDDAERRVASAKLQEVSPVVKQLVEVSDTGILEVIRVIPVSVKFRNFGEITQGIPPTVIAFPKQKTEAEWSELKLLGGKLKVWWIEMRPSFLIATVVPILLGAAIAWSQTGALSWPYLLLTVLAGVLLHAGTNIINDYFDHKSGNDEVNSQFVRPFSGGSRMIQLGLLTPVEVLSGGLVCFLAGSGAGIYLASTRGVLLLVIGLVGVISGFFYSAPPFKFANRGLGELLIGLNFGVLMVFGSYFVQTQRMDWEPFLAGLPVMFFIIAVVYINEFPDYEADRTVGKATLIVRLGRKRAAIGYVGIVGLGYLILILETTIGIAGGYVALGLLSFPFALKAIRSVLTHYERPLDLVSGNAATIMIHILTGALLIAGYILQRLGLRGLLGLLPLVVVTGFVMLWLHYHIEHQKNAFAAARASVAGRQS